MRAIFRPLLIDTVVTKRATRTSDGASGFVTTWNTVLASLKCRVYQANSAPKEFKNTSGVLDPSEYRMVCDVCDILRGDRVEHSGSTYEVLTLYPVKDDKSIHHYEIGLSKPR